jgi:hypothetical protein
MMRNMGLDLQEWLVLGKDGLILRHCWSKMMVTKMRNETLVVGYIGTSSSTGSALAEEFLREAWY